MKHKKKYAILNVEDLNKFENGTTVDEMILVKENIVKGKYDGIKILGRGEINKSLTIKSCLLSSSAKEKIEAAGGKIEA